MHACYVQKRLLDTCSRGPTRLSFPSLRKGGKSLERGENPPPRDDPETLSDFPLSAKRNRTAHNL